MMALAYCRSEGCPRVPPVRLGSMVLPRYGWSDIVEVREAAPARRDAFVESLWPLVTAESARYARLGGNQEELEAEGALALWEGVLSYDPLAHRTDPVRYLVNRVHQRVRRAYRAERGYDRAGAVLSAEPAPQDTEATPDPRSQDALLLAEWWIDLESSCEGLSESDRMRLAPTLTALKAGEAPRAPSGPADRKRLSRLRRRLRASLLAHHP